MSSSGSISTLPGPLVAAGRAARPAWHPGHASSTDGDARPLREAAARVSAWLRDRQAVDGHWRGPLEGDSILESEFILILAWADRLDRSDVAGAARRILRLQRADGGWSIHPDGPVDVSASVKA